jgi:hypothetical protein
MLQGKINPCNLVVVMIYNGGLIVLLLKIVVHFFLNVTIKIINFLYVLTRQETRNSMQKMRISNF